MGGLAAGEYILQIYNNKLQISQKVHLKKPF